MMPHTPCIGGQRHWFAAHGMVGWMMPFCVRCGEPRRRCPECGAVTTLVGDALSCARGDRFDRTEADLQRVEHARAIRARARG